jgi:hypothetical protein
MDEEKHIYLESVNMNSVSSIISYHHFKTRELGGLEIGITEPTPVYGTLQKVFNKEDN